VAGLDRRKVGTANVAATALRFFFKITLKRHDLAEEVVSTREPRRLPIVLSPEEVGRLLASATNIKHKALLSLAYATGLRASEVVSLKLAVSIVTGWSSGSNRARACPREGGARRIGTSFSRPSLSRFCATGGALRARRDGCLPVSSGCSPATVGSIGVHASSTGSFAWQQGVPASPSVSAFAVGLLRLRNRDRGLQRQLGCRGSGRISLQQDLAADAVDFRFVSALLGPFQLGECVVQAPEPGINLAGTRFGFGQGRFQTG
jgi:hypothetical protein